MPLDASDEEAFWFVCLTDFSDATPLAGSQIGV